MHVYEIALSAWAGKMKQNVKMTAVQPVGEVVEVVETGKARAAKRRR